MKSNYVHIGGVVKDNVERDLAQACATLGYKAALKAYQKHSFKHRTHNLHDSYGSAVYLNGKLVPETIRYVNRARSTTDDTRRGRTNGRKALEDFLRTAWVVNKRDYITILVVAAMWYGKILEEKKYIVLPYEEVKATIVSEFDSTILPVLKKHKIESFLPVLRRGLGADMTYYRENR